jgi:integrase
LLSYWVLPLNSEALAILKAWRRQTKFEFVFTNEVGERLRAVRDWQKTKKAAKIENFRFMDTLHHTATLQDHRWAWPGCIERVDASQRGGPRALVHAAEQYSFADRTRVPARRRTRRPSITLLARGASGGTRIRTPEGIHASMPNAPRCDRYA